MANDNNIHDMNNGTNNGPNWGGIFSALATLTVSIVTAIQQIAKHLPDDNSNSNKTGVDSHVEKPQSGSNNKA